MHRLNLIATSRWASGLVLAMVVGLFLCPAPAYAAGGHVPLVPASIPVIGPVVHTLGGAVGSIFSTIGGALLGAFKWTIGLATNFIPTTIAALVKMLIPHSWVHKGLQIMQWIVAVPDTPARSRVRVGGTRTGSRGSTRCAMSSRGWVSRSRR